MEDLKIINYNENGITKRSLQEIYAMLVDKVREIYGVDVDITPDNADGIMQRVFATFLSDVAELSEQVYNTLNLDVAEGVWLDSLCALSNVYRRSASATTGIMTLTLPSSIVVPINKRLRIVDSSNIIWYGPVETVETTYADGDTIYLTCGRTGEYLPTSTLLAMYIDGIVVLSGTFAYSAFTVEELGSTDETDEELRSRRYRMGMGMFSGSLVESIINSLLTEFPILSDVLLYNNNTATSQSIVLPNGASAITLASHDLALFVRPKYGSTLSDSLKIQIADLIRRKVTPGIHTWFNPGVAPAGYEEYEFAVEGHASWVEKYTYFVAQPVEPQINLHVQALAGFDSTLVEARIREALITLSKSYRINQTLYSADLFNIISQVNLSQGTPTFKVLTITFGSVSPTSSVDTQNGYWYIDDDTVIAITTA